MRFGTRQTLQFVREWLNSKSHVLEVGCGDGELAVELQSLGHSVVAIDANPGNVVAARGRGVDVRCASWPDFYAGRFNAVLFTRSLHHIAPLDRAVEVALRTAPRILVEDFSLSEAGPRTLHLLREVESLADHDIHPFASIFTAIGARSAIQHYSEVPYCYRYFDEDEAQRIYQEEQTLGERLLGRRIVAEA